MGVSIDWVTGVITIPKAYTTLVQLTPVEIRNLDTNLFRIDLRDLEDDIDGRPWPWTHDHNEDVLIGGISLADVLLILEPYTITFEDGQWAVNLVGTNNNILERTNKNQVSVNPGNSAGLVNSLAIEYGEYGGEVNIDVVNGELGSIYPIGTHRRPSNNLTDALIIAAARGFLKIHFTSDFTFTNTTFISDFIIRGEGSQETTITFEAGCFLINCNIREVTATGSVSGITGFKNALVINLNSVSPIPSSQDIIIQDCLLAGELTVPSNYSGAVKVIDCWKDDTIGIPVLNLGDSEADIIIHNYSGGVKIINATQGNNITISLNTGIVELDSTVTNTNIIIRGIGKLVDNSGISVTPNSEELISPESIAEAVWDAILTGDTHNISTSAGRRLRELAGNIITAGTAQLGSTNNTIVLNGNASVVDGSYDPSMIAIVGGTGAGQCRGIFQYAGSIKTAVIDRNWKVIPDDTTEYVIYGWPGREHVNEGLARGGTSNTIILNTLGSIHDGAYVNQLVFIRSGTGEDQVGVVKSYIGSTKTAKLYDPWEIIPDTTSGYVMIPNHVHPEGTAKAVWDSIPSIPITGSFGEFIINLWDEAGGDRKIDETANQEIFYKAGDGAEVMRFDLFDINGNPASQNVYKRVRV